MSVYLLSRVLIFIGLSVITVRLTHDSVEQTMRGLGGRSSAHAVTAASYPPVLKVYSSG